MKNAIKMAGHALDHPILFHLRVIIKLIWRAIKIRENAGLSKVEVGETLLEISINNGHLT